MAEVTRPRSKGYMTFLVIFMGLVALVDQYLSLIETTAIPHLINYFGITADTFFLWQGIFGIMAFVVFLVSGLADLYGRKIGILILLLMMGGSATLIGLIGTSSFWVFMILYAILILGNNVNLWTIPISEESIPKRRAFNGSMAFLIGLIPLYAFIGEPIAAALGWQWMYGAMGIFGLIIIVLLIFMKETKRWEASRGEEKHIGKNYWDNIKAMEKKDWFLVIRAGSIYICWNIAFKMATGTVGLYYQNIQGLTADEFSSILTFGGLATIVGALSIGIIMEKLGRIFAFIYSSVGAAIAYLGLSFLGNSIFMVFAYYFMACFLGFLLVYITELFPTERRATAVGLTLTLSRIGYVVGPLVISAILFEETVATYRTLYLVGAIIALVPLLSLFLNKYESKGKSLEAIQEDIKAE
ncbi:MAG: MFS transporter [Promethearchaeota archaeon]|nr:MAG: MFS transporter [Candidatus Lokiarchaeota archaeon]